MIRLWEWLRGSRRRKGAFLYAIVMGIAIAWTAVTTPREAPLEVDRDPGPLHNVERAAFDWQMNALRRLYPRTVDKDVVLIGIDEATYAHYPEPVALWHRHFGDVLRTLARAGPQAVGVDVAPPERSYDDILRGSDLALMRGMIDVRRASVLVYVRTLSDKRKFLPVQSNLMNLLGEEGFGLDQQVFDNPDLTSRRFGELRDAGDGSPVPSFAGRILRRTGRPVQEGFIDYSIGEPVRYIPMHEVGDWDDESLRQAVSGRIVLIGSLVGFVDRWRLPVRLMASDPGRQEKQVAESKLLEQPGVLIHLQTLRSHLAGSILRPLPDWVQWIAVAFAALAVFVSGTLGVVLLGGVLMTVVVEALGLTTIVSAQTLVPVASVIATFWIALVVRGVFDSIEAVVDRLRLQASFAGQVSPAVMKEMLGGNLSPGVSGQLAEVCVLFSDVRDFTTLSEEMPPKVVTTVLQRYFDRMVHAVHRFDGTVDKFIGDGMMVLFGAPRKSADPCGDAVQCALAMMNELDQLNVEFGREGLPQLTIGIGINYGTVTVGNIGSSERHN
ncbi:MAG TPA: adenylate/guanylate cyclase domain-containing protein, partial [Usitatibacter sp.]|nr:adenylate/guanylate cyclase domain-containing protein [Usitatibacter sp.]